MQVDEAAPSTSTSTSTEPTSTPASTSTTEEEKEKSEKKERDAKRELAKKKKLQQELNQIGDKLPEADCFLSLLVVISLLDRGEYEKVSALLLPSQEVMPVKLETDETDASRKTGQAIHHPIDRKVLGVEPTDFGSTHEQDLLLLGSITRTFWR
jgi:hypothetical protein